MVGDGGFLFALEKRGYVKAGPWTPEAVVESPEAGMYIRTGKGTLENLKKWVKVHGGGFLPYMVSTGTRVMPFSI